MDRFGQRKRRSSKKGKCTAAGICEKDEWKEKRRRGSNPTREEICVE
jgi:hypothetical protein